MESKQKLIAKPAHKEDYIFTVNLVSGVYCCDIDGKDLVYCDLNSHHGMQCNLHGSEEGWERIQRLCKVASDAIKEIHKINYGL